MGKTEKEVVVARITNSSSLLLVLFLAASLYAADSAVASFGIFGFPLEQSSIKIDPKDRNRQKFDIDIKRHCLAKRCPVNIGLEYESMRGLPEDTVVRSYHIREVFFPNDGHKPTVPHRVHLKMYNSKSEMIIDEIKEPGEFKTGWIRGGPTITATFGHQHTYCLPPGKYSIEFQIISEERDLSEISMRIVVLNDIKTRCTN